MVGDKAREVPIGGNSGIITTIDTPKTEEQIHCTPLIAAGCYGLANAETVGRGSGRGNKI